MKNNLASSTAKYSYNNNFLPSKGIAYIARNKIQEFCGRLILLITDYNPTVHYHWDDLNRLLQSCSEILCIRGLNITLHISYMCDSESSISK